MMNMMYSTTGMTGIGSGSFWLHLHGLFGALTIVGFVLLTAWALKNLSGAALKSVTLWLLGIGIIGVLLTAPFAANSFQWRHSGYANKDGGMMMNGPMGSTGSPQVMMQMMNTMMSHDEGVEGAEHDEHEEMEEMMRTMMNQ